MVKKKKFKKPKTDNLAEKILAKFNSKPTQTYNYKQIGKLLKIRQPVMLKTIQHHLTVLTGQKKLTEVKPGKYRLNYVAEMVKGTVDMTNQGSAFIISENSEQDIFVASRNLNRAFHGDLVQVSINPGGKGKRPEGIITKVIKRKKETLVGIVEVSKNHAFFIPDDQRITVDVYIAKPHLNGALNGQKVIVKLKDWPDDADSPFGEIIEVLGFPGEHQTEMHAILAEYGLPLNFPDFIEREAEAIDSTISKEEIKKRRDFRGLTTFTIDPHDAKDFDDALSFKKLMNKPSKLGFTLQMLPIM